MTEAEARELVSARERATTATPGLQRALTAVGVVAGLSAVVALALFNFSLYRSMDIAYGVNALGRSNGADTDYKAWAVCLAAFVGALLVLAGTWLDVTARSRTFLMSLGAGLLVLIGTGAGFILDPSRGALRSHYHVGEWGTAAGFDRWVRTLETLGWVAAVCGVVLVALMVRQRRRIVAAFPEEGDE